MSNSHLLQRNQRHRVPIVSNRIRANGNFSDASLERLHSVTQHKSRDEPEWRYWPGVTPNKYQHKQNRKKSGSNRDFLQHRRSKSSEAEANDKTMRCNFPKKWNEHMQQGRTVEYSCWTRQTRHWPTCLSAFDLSVICVKYIFSSLTSGGVDTVMAITRSSEVSRW